MAKPTEEQAHKGDAIWIPEGKTLEQISRQPLAVLYVTRKQTEREKDK